LQGILLSPLSENVLGGALGTDVLNLGGLVGLTAGVGFQLWVASVNYAQNAPEGYNAVKDVRVSVSWPLIMRRRLFCLPRFCKQSLLGAANIDVGF
jgi:hypothetical protein